MKLKCLLSQECEHNPKKLVHCDVGCGLLVAKDELPVCIFCYFTRRTCYLN